MHDRLTVIPDGQKAIVLTSADHMATGGEGSVYAQANTVYKIYLSIDKAIASGMERKLPLLTAIRHPGIVSPQGALRDKNGKFLGLYMPRSSGEAMCKLFTNTWRDLHNIGTTESVKLTDSMRAVILAAHSHKAILVDGNEMNWLANNGTEAQVIDVDSWQIGGFPGTAIMASIRDYSEDTFSENTDWFAWAVVSFQLWTGIHPYKGTHPDYARGTMEARMRARASVFDPKVRLPAAARSPTQIPIKLRDWYERVFQSDERSCPPLASASAIGTQTAPKLKVIQSIAGKVKQERIESLGGRVRGVFSGIAIYETGKRLFAHDVVHKKPVSDLTDGELVALTEGKAAIVRLDAALVYAQIDAGAIVMRLLCNGRSSGTATLPTRATRLWQTETRLFAVVENAPNGLVEIDASKPNDRLIAGARTAWPVAALSTRLFDGVFVQDCMGMPFVGVLEGRGLCQGRAPALKGYRILSGFGRDSANVWLAGIRMADGERIRLRLAGGANGFVVEEECIVDDISINGATTLSGVGVVFTDDVMRVYKGISRKDVDKPGLSDSLRLFQLGAGIGGYDGAELIKITLG
jgi:hypothetical protein